MTLIFLVGFGGFLGAITRYLLTIFFNNLIFFYSIPIGTLFVNLIGSLIMGFLFAIFQNLEIESNLKFMLTTGFLGALTTFSTFALETFLLLEKKEYLTALISISFNLFGTIIAVVLGIYLFTIIKGNF
jgi:CrcB protein